MEMKTPWQIAALILSRLNGTITESESVQLDAWIESSPHHRDLANKIINEKNFEDYEKKCAEYNYSLKFKEFSRYMETRRRKRLFRRLARVAAVVIPLALSVFLWEYDRSDDQSLVGQNELITPGSFQALLTLPNGKVITLNDIAKETQIENGLALIQEDTLIYSLNSEDIESEYHTLDVPLGGEFILRLADGSKVWLNSGTQLRYPAHFSGGERKVFLKGEAYFEIARDTLCPFRVETEKQQLTVLGTSFCVRAYEDEHRVVTTLESGKVNISAYDKQMTLLPGFQSKVMDERIVMEKVNTSLYTAWHKGRFIFIDQSLEDILTTLSRWYNVSIFYTSSELEKLCFTGELQRYEDIRELLEKIEVLEKVKFEIKGRTIVVSRY
ncbi:MAG: DUF4974 domain-containing protein [Odoribacter sp.]